MKDQADVLRAKSRQSPASVDREAARTNLRAQGIRTRSMIVEAATKMLLQGGGLDFTLRAVSREAKISISNLQYYFPDRQELLRAVMAPVIESYLADLKNALSSDVPARQVFDELVERTIRDAKDPATMSLMWHFASLATIDSECSRLFDEWYEALVRGIARLVERINPDLGPAGSIQLAMLLISMSDGLGFQMKAGRDHKYTLDLGDSFRTTVDFLLQRNPLTTRDKIKGRAGPR